MEDRIAAFLSISYGSGYGSGFGGDGYGYGSGSGYGSGGDGYGDGSGDGFGFGDGVTQFDGKAVYQIDDIPTIITSVRGPIAKGFILKTDLTLKPCYIAKRGDFFAHGTTAEEAFDEAEAKYLEESPLEDRIELFVSHFSKDSHPASEFSIWHGILTGSCRMGREVFCESKGIKENTMMTVPEFISLAKWQYGSDVIMALEQRYAEEVKK